MWWSLLGTWQRYYISMTEFIDRKSTKQWFIFWRITLTRILINYAAQTIELDIAPWSCTGMNPIGDLKQLILPSILLSTALCRSGFCRARRFRSSFAHTMKAFIGLLIRDSTPDFPSLEPRVIAPGRVESGLPDLASVAPPLLPVRDPVRVPEPGTGTSSVVRLWLKPCPLSGPGAQDGAPHVPRSTTWLGWELASWQQLDSDIFIPTRPAQLKHAVSFWIAGMPALANFWVL